jgi:hypothetical protein
MAKLSDISIIVLWVCVIIIISGILISMFFMDNQYSIQDLLQIFNDKITNISNQYDNTIQDYESTIETMQEQITSPRDIIEPIYDDETERKKNEQQSLLQSEIAFSKTNDIRKTNALLSVQKKLKNLQTLIKTKGTNIEKKNKEEQNDNEEEEEDDDDDKEDEKQPELQINDTINKMMTTITENLYHKQNIDFPVSDVNFGSMELETLQEYAIKQKQILIDQVHINNKMYERLDTLQNELKRINNENEELQQQSFLGLQKFNDFLNIDASINIDESINMLSRNIQKIRTKLNNPDITLNDLANTFEQYQKKIIEYNTYKAHIKAVLNVKSVNDTIPEIKSLINQKTEKPKKEEPNKEKPKKENETEEQVKENKTESLKTDHSELYSNLLYALNLHPDTKNDDTINRRVHRIVQKNLDYENKFGEIHKLLENTLESSKYEPFMTGKINFKTMILKNDDKNNLNENDDDDKKYDAELQISDIVAESGTIGL